MLFVCLFYSKRQYYNSTGPLLIFGGPPKSRHNKHITNFHRLKVSIPTYFCNFASVTQIVLNYKMVPTRRDFFDQPCLVLAKSLLGKVLVRKVGGEILKGRIVETESYITGCRKFRNTLGGGWGSG